MEEKYFDEGKTAKVSQAITVQWERRCNKIEEAAFMSEMLQNELRRRKDTIKDILSRFEYQENGKDVFGYVIGLARDYNSYSRKATCYGDIIIELDVTYESWRDEPTEEDIKAAEEAQWRDILTVDGWDLDYA